MNILFVTGAFAHNNKDSALGGMERAVYKSAMGMKQLGHNVRILAADRIERTWKYQGIEVKSIKAINIFECISDTVLLAGIIDRELQFRKEIYSINKKWNIDIIQYTGWYGVGLFRPLNFPSIMRISSYTNLQFKDDFSPKRENLLSRLECMAVRRMDYVFAPSNLMAKKLEHDSGRTISVIETPYMQESVEEDDSIFNDLIGKKKYILFFGRLSLDKGIYTIRDVLYKTLTRYRDINFVFAGNGTINNGVRIETELHNAAREFGDRVICLGSLNKNKLQPIIKNAEFVVLPSIRDNLPNTCAEAMALGKIVIGTDGSSLEQFIVDGHNGFLAQINNPESLLKKIEQVCNLEEADKARISKNAISRIKELDILPYSQKMERNYYNVIEKMYER